MSKFLTTTDKTAKVSVNHNTYMAIQNLHIALRDEFGCDFAYAIMGKGYKLAASNMQDGQINPKSNLLEKARE